MEILSKLSGRLAELMKESDLNRTTEKGIARKVPKFKHFCRFFAVFRHVFGLLKFTPQLHPKIFCR